MSKFSLTLWACLGLVMMGSAQADVGALYQKSCAACHDDGTFNAPKKGDRKTWQALLQQKGMDGLVRSTHKGMPQMPAGGLCANCSDRQFVQLIEYMSQ